MRVEELNVGNENYSYLLGLDQMCENNVTVTIVTIVTIVITPD